MAVKETIVATWGKFFAPSLLDVNEGHALVSVKGRLMLRGHVNPDMKGQDKVLMVFGAQTLMSDGVWKPVPHPGILMVPWNRVLMIQALTPADARQLTMSIQAFDSGRGVRSRPQKRHERI